MNLYRVVLLQPNGKTFSNKNIAATEEEAVQHALAFHKTAVVQEVHAVNPDESIADLEERLKNCRQYMDSKLDMLIKQRVALSEYEDYAVDISKNPVLCVYRVYGEVEGSVVYRRLLVAHEDAAKRIFLKEFPNALDVTAKPLSVSHQIAEIRKLIGRIEANIEEKIQNAVKYSKSIQKHIDYKRRLSDFS